MVFWDSAVRQHAAVLSLANNHLIAKVGLINNVSEVSRPYRGADVTGTLWIFTRATGRVVSRAGLEQSCTLMQWFIFGLRASWTSSIIVIHRRSGRRGAARAGAGAPAWLSSRSPTFSPQARDTAMHFAHAWPSREYKCLVSRCRRPRVITVASAFALGSPAADRARTVQHPLAAATTRQKHPRDGSADRHAFPRGLHGESASITPCTRCTTPSSQHTAASATRPYL